MLGLISPEYHTDVLRQEVNLCRLEGRLIWRFLKAELDRRESEEEKADAVDLS